MYKATILGLMVALAAALPAPAADVSGKPDLPTPYIPSTTLAVDEMLRVADVRPGDFVIDLGSGDYEIDFEQNFQRIKGGSRVEGGYLPAFDAQLAGNTIRFVLVENQQTSHHFEGRVEGWTLAGVVRSGPGRERATGRWRATRVTS